MSEPSVMLVSRRSWLQRLLALTGTAALLGHRLSSAGTVEAETGTGETGPLIVRVSRPFDAETPVRELASFLTPNHRFFVRSHFGPPALEVVSEANWTLRIDGMVNQPNTFTLEELKQLERVTITAVVQCSGNGRAFHYPKVPGVQWEKGAVGNAEWTGVRLRDLLGKAGIKEGARHVQLQGADRPIVASVPLFTRSLPLTKAFHPDTILAYEMNGRPLPLLHGAPLRVIAPGWMADSCIKWLTEITVQKEEAKGYYMQTAYRAPATPIEAGAEAEEQAMLPIEAMVVKSLIAAPAEGDEVRFGPVTIQGVAWSGDTRITRVDLSFDEGVTWQPARLIGEDRPYAWRQWQFIWQAKKAGSFTILCRATDARGETQPAKSPWNPGGFLWNGWDRVTATVTGA